MYYVIYVNARNESNAKDMISRYIPDDLYSDCFYPVRLMKKKLRGKWTIVHERLIPGYIFIESDDVKSLYKELRQLPMFLRLLGKEESGEEIDIYPLSDEEVRWLNILSQRKDAKQDKHLIELSKVGFDENDEVIVLDGPLLGLQGKIKKINLHKRIAEVELKFMNQDVVFYLGIDIIEKAVKKV